MKTKNIIWLLLIIGLISCKTPKIIGDYEVTNKKYTQKDLNLTYSSLLDRKDTDYKSKKKYFKNFTINLSKSIKEENFKWEVPDSIITIMHRTYFDKNGNIDYLFFKITNPSVSAKKRNELKKALLKFSKEVKLGLKINEQSANCGKIKIIKNNN